MTALTFLDHFLAVISGVLLPFMALITKTLSEMSDEEPQPLELSTNQKLQLYRSNSIIQWAGAGLVILVWLYNDRSIGSIGFQLPDFSSPKLVIGLVITFLLGYGYDIIRQLSSAQARAALREEWQKEMPILPATGQEFKGFMTVAFTAGICEEIIYRGFLINYLAYSFAPTGQGLIMAVAVPSFIFGISHLYQGWEGALKITLLSLVFGALFLITGSLLIPIILHILVDVIGGWIGWWVITKRFD